MKKNKKRQDQDEIVAEDKKLKLLEEKLKNISVEENENPSGKMIFNNEVFSKVEKKELSQKKTEKKQKQKKNQEKKEILVKQEEKSESDISNEELEELENEDFQGSDLEVEEPEEEIITKSAKNSKKEKNEKKENKKQKNKELEPNQNNLQKSIHEEDFKSAIYEQLWMIGIIFLFLILVSVSKYYEEKYTKYARYMYSNREGFKDFYEVLGVDSSVSQSEIKQQYKKLAVLWHPDKNPDCGNTCKEKFQEILEAYEVLGNDEKRKSYDEMTGVITPIKSKTVSLTESNFRRLVLDRNDIWVIQVYEDANPFCEQMAELWDLVASEFAGSIKFGRINVGTQRSVLRYLPINVVLLPTILSMVKGEETEIFSFYNRDVYNSLKKFVGKIIIDKTKKLNSDGFSFLYEENKEGIHNKPQLLYLLKSSTLPVQYKYNAFLHHKWLDFYATYYKDLIPINKQLKRKVDLAYFYTDFSGNRTILEFAFKGDLEKRHYEKILTLAKFHTVPNIYNDNYNEFCNKAEGAEEEKKHMCIFLIDNGNNTKKEILKKKTGEIIEELSKKLVSNIRSDSPLFQAYNIFQFSFLDFSFHSKLRKKLIHLHEEVKLEEIKAIAIIPENQKVAILKNLNNYEDWVFGLLEAGDEEHYYYLRDCLGEDEFHHFLRAEEESLIKIFGKLAIENAKNYTILISFLCFILAMLFYKKKIKPISIKTILVASISFYVLSVGIFSMSALFDEL